MVFERVLVVLIDSEVSGEALIQKRVIIFEDYFHVIFGLLAQELFGNFNVAINILDVSRVKSLPVDHHKLHA